MKIFFYIIVSALLLTYLPLQLSSLLTPDDYIALYAAIFLCLIINGLFIHLISKKHGNAAGSTRKPNKNRKHNNNRTRRPNSRNKPRTDSRDAGRKHSTADDSEQLDGTIKWYNRRKSYGFIVDSSGEEIFFHQQELELVNGKPPMVDKGLSVKFHKTLTEKGPQAQRVRIVE